MKRIQREAILKDLSKKLVLLVGPRQAGKTWLTKDIASEFLNPIYLNYDQPQDKKIIQKQAWLDSTDLLVLDELHKMKGWKNFLKGVYDTKPASMKILVTGSARLDVYDRIGDSLAGRYFRHRLLPLSLAELHQVSEPLDLERLIVHGGFPEPYLAEDELDASRWRLQYTNSLLSTDVFQIDQIYNLKALRLVFDLLRARVGSPVSYRALAEDVSVSPMTIKKYIQILEALYIVFTIHPYSKNIARSLLREPKLYFFDTGLVEGDEGAKFENMVAVSLLKHAYGMVDYKAENYNLQYIRTKEKQEVDFALVHNDKVEKIIEVSVSDNEPTKALKYFHEKYQYPAIQIVKHLRKEFKAHGIQVLKAENFLKLLQL